VLVRTALLSLLLLLPACGEGLLDPERLEQAIVNGQVTSGYPTAVPLYEGGQFSCSATLIGKQTLLTAAHCVTAGASYKAVVGGVTIAVASAVTHPSYDAQAITNDVAVMRLASAAPIPPIAISTVPPTVGLPLEIVGYGCIAENDQSYGTKRVAKNTVKSVLTDQFMFTGSTGAIGGHCYGDSGGPTYAVVQGLLTQIGVHSWGPVPCGGDNYDARVDVFASWIAQQAAGDVSLGQKPDTTRPTVTIVAPLSGATVPASTKVQIQVQDEVGLAKVELFVDGASRGLFAGGSGARELPLALAEGDHTLRVVASDAAGNAGEQSISVRVASVESPTPPPTTPSQPTQPANPSPTIPGSSAGSNHESGTVIGLGCQMAGGPAAPDLTLLLLGLVGIAGLAGRARTRRAASSRRR
jgi:hypothetical protein